MKSMKSYYKILMVLFLSLWFNLTLAGDKPSSQSVTAGLGSYKSLKIDAGLEYTIKYKQPPKGDQVEMVYKFLEMNKDFFQVTNPREELTPNYRNDRVVSFQQTHRGIVLPSGVKARFSRGGELTSVEGSYIYDINLSTNYSIDSLSAIQMTLKDIGPLPESEVGMPSCPSKPIIAHSSAFDFKNEDRLYLVWPVTVVLVTAAPAKQDTIRYQDGTFDVTPFIEEGHYGYYIDALTGNILQKGKSSLTEMYKARRARGYLGTD